MRSLIFAILIVCSTLFGQENDLSMWAKNTAVIPWYLHIDKKVVVDLRYNFDAKRTGGICIGKAIGKESLTLIPEACGYIGQTNGYGPELLILAGHGKYSVFSQNQFFQAVGGDTSYFYHWTDFQIKVVKGFSAGFGEQICKSINDDPGQIDVGPSVKLAVGKIYFKFWPTWSVGPANRGEFATLVGVGYAW